MLKELRSGLKGIVAWAFVALLVLSFALWGVPELRDFTQRPPMRVGSVAFSAQAVQNEYNRAIQRRRAESGGKFTAEEARASGLGEQVVNQLATRSILEQEARKLGLVMPTTLVKDYLQTNEAFRNPATGKFDAMALQNILQANSLTQEQFETIITQDLLRDQLVRSVAQGGPPAKPILDALLLRQVEIRKVGYLTVTDDMAGAAVQPTPDDLKRYYEKEKTAFQTPEHRVFSAVIIRPSDFSQGDATSEADLRAIYEANRTRLYESPEKRTIYQANFDSEAEAEAAAASLRSGGPFEKVAQSRGLSLAAATLTEITRKDLVDPAVAEAVFADGLQAGDVAGPVKGLFGWTVAQIAGIKPPQTQPFELVRGEIAQKLGEDAARKKLFEAVEAIEAARDTGAVLADAARSAGLSARSFGPVDAFSFAPGGAIVADLPGEVLKEAFLIAEGEESEAKQLEDGGYFFIHLEKINPPAVLPYAEVEDEVDRKWRADERRARIAAAVKGVVDAVAAGKSLSEAAAPFNRAVIERVLSRGQVDDAFSAELAEKVFAAGLNTVIAGPAGASDAQTLVEIREIGYARNRIGPGEETAFQQFIGYQLNQEYLEAYLATLREDYGVRTNREQLAVLFNEAQ